MKRKKFAKSCLFLAIVFQAGCVATKGGERDVIADGADGGDGEVIGVDSDVIRECMPGQKRCGANGTREICLGSGFWEDDPCPEDRVCVSGECLPIVCQRSERRCNPDDPRQVQICDETGTGWVLSMVCPGDSVCEDGVCVPQTCTPEDILCTGEGKVRKCNETGTGYGDPLVNASPLSVLRERRAASIYCTGEYATSSVVDTT